MPSELVTMTLRVSPELAERVRQAAAADERSVNTWIRRALEAQLRGATRDTAVIPSRYA